MCGWISVILVSKVLQDILFYYLRSTIGAMAADTRLCLCIPVWAQCTYARELCVSSRIEIHARTYTNISGMRVSFQMKADLNIFRETCTRFLFIARVSTKPHINTHLQKNIFLLVQVELGTHTCHVLISFLWIQTHTWSAC
jgi:hypothetical protein